MSKCLHPCLQLAAVTLLIYLTLKGVSPRAVNNVIKKAVEDLKQIQEPWGNLSYLLSYYENENITVVVHNVECDDLDLIRLPNIIHALEVAQRYAHYLEGPDYDFEPNCARFQQTGPQHGGVGYLIGVLIDHLIAECAVDSSESTSINCTVIGKVGSANFPHRVEISLRDVRDFFQN